MSKITIHLPYRTLRMEYRAAKPVFSRLTIKLSKKRKSREDNSFLSVLAQIRTIRNGNKASRVVRHTVDRFNIKAILGGNITLMVLAAGVIVPQSNIAQAQAESQVLPAIDAHLTTEVNLRYPLGKFSFNQGFSTYHPGVDLGDPIGTPVFAMENGNVLSTEYDKFGYGNSIVIAHDKGITTRYAHLSRIDVHVGDPVTTSTKVGLSGNTGHSTGPHLHFEVRKNDVPLNPIAFLGPVSAK